MARKLEAYANNGAYASHGHAICANCGNVFKDLYRDELGTEVDCFTVYTSSPTAGAMRGLRHSPGSMVCGMSHR